MQDLHFHDNEELFQENMYADRVKRMSEKHPASNFWAKVSQLGKVLSIFPSVASTSQCRASDHLNSIHQ